MIFPAITETLVLPIDADEVERRIGDGITNRKFVGVIDENRFSLTPYLSRPPQFQPVTRGTIERSSRGSMIFLKYELLPATRLLLVFVFLILIVVAVVAFVMEASIYYSFFSLAMVVIFRSVALANIRIHRDPVRQNLLDILS